MTFLCNCITCILGEIFHVFTKYTFGKRQNAHLANYAFCKVIFCILDKTKNFTPKKTANIFFKQLIHINFFHITIKFVADSI